jgi:hypothetical protein
MKDTQKTQVIFRVWTGKNAIDGSDNVIALFPNEPGAHRKNGTLVSYEHVGQHGEADYYTVMSGTRPAAPAEYKALKRELESEPFNYNFEIRTRHPNKRVR